MFTTCSWNSSNINSSKELSKRLKLLSFAQRGHPQPFVLPPEHLRSSNHSSVTRYRYIIVGHGTARWAHRSVGGTPRHRKGQESRERCDHRSAAANHSQCECVCGLSEYGWNRLFESAAVWRFRPKYSVVNLLFPQRFHLSVWCKHACVDAGSLGNRYEIEKCISTAHRP